MAYSERERALLQHYFSSIEPRDHADIYLVRNLPAEVAATLNGVYSRSRLQMRDQFLERLKRGLEASGRGFEAVDIPLPTQDFLGKVMTEKAGQFLKTYAIDHGHNSLREGSVVHLAVENVSQLVTRFVQRERRCSFEESSTRYISFSEEGHWRDPEVTRTGGEVAAAYEEILHSTFTLYREISELLAEHLKQSRPLAAGEKPGPWLRALKAEAFDAARYLLTPAIYTKWGIVADARTLSEIITELLSHPLEEFQIVGRRIKEQAEIELPTLLAHAKENGYLKRQHDSLGELAAGFGAAERVTGEGRPGIELLSYDRDLDSRLLASLVYTESNQPYETLLRQCQAMDPARRQELMDDVLGSRGQRDALPLAIEGADPFDFELLVDFGAYRDIGRHRKGLQQQQALTTAHGYLVPPLVKEAGLAGRFTAVLDRVAQLHEVVARAHPLAASYVTPFAFLQRVRIQFEPRQCAYFIELRSGPEGHFAYRQSALDLFHAIQEVSPLFASFIRAKEGAAVCGRMQAEQGAEERRRQRMERAGDA